MNVCVVGLWHLGAVTSCCLAAIGHHVVGLDFDTATIRGLQEGVPPIHEPGLAELLKAGLADRRLSFTNDPADALRTADIIWITYDTPVDEDDRADVDSVLQRVRLLFPHIPAEALVLVSSQLPVGTTRTLAEDCAAAQPGKNVSFACSPENLRLGKAIQVFMHPDRVVVGTAAESDRPRLAALFGPLNAPIEWMSVESAEMTKHALNAFLATSVAFSNEIAILCERVGANAREVERGLKTDVRIGLKAYLGPGLPFGGGTLARDVTYLRKLGADRGLAVPLLGGVKMSNDAHKLWMRDALTRAGGPLRDRRVAIWGLAYKSGTDTLRRSLSVELASWLLDQGAKVRCHDPSVKALPTELARADQCSSPEEALDGASALVVANDWPGYASVSADTVVGRMAKAHVIDPDWRLAGTLGKDGRIRYWAVGKADI